MSDLPAGYTLDGAAPLPAGYALDPPSVAADVVKSGATGLLKGAIGLGTMAADMRALRDAGVDKFGEKLGIDHDYTGYAKQGLHLVDKGVGMMMPGSSLHSGGFGPFNPSGATQGDVINKIEQYAGPLHQAQTVPGQYAERIGEFAPAVLGGEGALIPRLIRQVLVPALASETAGQVTQGTAAEPYARIAAALVSPVAAEKVAASRAASAAAARATPTIEEATKAGSAGFEAPEVKAVTFTPGTIEDVSNIAASDLKRSRLNDRLAPATHAVLDDLKTPINGTAHTIEDVQTSRQLLGDLAGNFANPTEQKAATQAIKTLDKLIETMPQSRVATGDIAAANATLKNARGDYAAAKTAERVQEKLNNADLQASSTYSGGNLNNATRQKLLTLLTSKSGARGLTEDELQSIEDTVRGSAIGNAARTAGKLLGGGGGWGSIATAAAGHLMLPGLGIATPLVGYGVKKVGDAITRSNANAIVNQILRRSPLGMQRAAAEAEAMAPRLPLFPINESPYQADLRLKARLPHLVRVDAAQLRNVVERNIGQPLIWNKEKANAVRRAGGDDKYPRVQINDRGQPAIDDGRHRVAVAAERGQAIDVAVRTPEEARALQRFSPRAAPVIDPSINLLKALLLSNAATVPLREQVGQLQQ